MWKGKLAAIVKGEPLMFVGALLTLAAGLVQMAVDGTLSYEAVVPIVVAFIGRWFVSPATR